jgi:hypothetical protein
MNAVCPEPPEVSTHQTPVTTGRTPERQSVGVDPEALCEGLRQQTPFPLESARTQELPAVHPYRSWVLTGTSMIQRDDRRLRIGNVATETTCSSRAGHQSRAADSTTGRTGISHPSNQGACLFSASCNSKCGKFKHMGVLQLMRRLNHHLAKYVILKTCKLHFRA